MPILQIASVSKSWIIRLYMYMNYLNKYFELRNLTLFCFAFLWIIIYMPTTNLFWIQTNMTPHYIESEILFNAAFTLTRLLHTGTCYFSHKNYRIILYCVHKQSLYETVTISNCWIVNALPAQTNCEQYLSLLFHNVNQFIYYAKNAKNINSEINDQPADLNTAVPVK